MSSPSRSPREWLRSVALVAVVSAGLLSVIGSGSGSGSGGGGGGGGGGGHSGPNEGNGWLNITDPARGYQTDRLVVTLSGYSFIPDGTSCPGLGQATLPPGYQVTWSNNANGQSGKASTSISCVSFLFGDLTWNADVLLAGGTNSITVTATDGLGNVGRDTIEVTRALDNTPPSVTSVNPANNATCAAIDGLISAKFSESIDTATVNESSFLLMDDMGAAVVGVVRATSDRSAAFNPRPALAYDTSYTATITSAVTDFEGSAMASDYTWSFTTQPSRVGTWSRVATGDAAVSRHTAVWTGSQMIVWGGIIRPTLYTSALYTGGRYYPTNDEWVPTTTVGAPSARYGHTAVWTGSEMIVWGGINQTILDTGGRYDPIRDTWQPVSTSGAPSARSSATAVWTGSEMIVWGGRNGYSGDIAFGDGARYDPVSDTWLPVSTVGAPSARYGHTAVWTGSEMIVWGGRDSGGTLGNGARYNPSTNTWTPIVATGAPALREGHVAVWTGTEMIVWGDTFGATNSGGIYDPAADSWRAMDTRCAPPRRTRFPAIWTGTQMIVWGGGRPYHYYADGAAYDPVADTWTPLAPTGAPTARADHTAVWTGSEMIVWGGTDGEILNSGGRFTP